MTMQYDENMGGWYDDGQSNNFAVAPEPAPAQSLAVQPAPDQGLAVQPAPMVKSGMVNERGMGPNVGDPYNGMGPPDLAVTPAIAGQDFAVNPPSAAPDYAAYTNAYPDLAAAAQAAGMDPAAFGAMHYAQSGKTEGRAVPPGGAAPTDPSLAVRSIGDTGAPAADPSLAVNPDGTPNTAPVNIAEGVRFNPEGLTDPATATVSTTPASAAAFDYSALVTGEPQLQNGPLQLSGGRTFNAQGPYYAPRTNSGDAAGAVYAGPDQKVRIIDPKTGDVVFEGVGPEGAKQATAIADAMSVNKGKKASWEIQGDFGDQGWKGMAQDLVDTKHNLLGKLADIALPIIGVLMALPTGGLSLGLTVPASLGGAAMAAGLGAAAGSTLSSVAQGRSVGDTLTRAAISGIGAGVVGPALSKVLPVGLGGTAGSAAGGSGITSSVLPAALPSVAGMTGQQALAAVNAKLLQEVVINGVRQLAPTAMGIAAGIGGAAGLPSNISGGSGTNAQQGGAPNDPITGTPVDEVVVNGVRVQPVPPPVGALPPPVGPLVGSMVSPALINSADLVRTPQTLADDAAKIEPPPTPVELSEVVVHANAVKAALTPLQKTLIFGGLITPAALAAQLSAAGTPTTEAEAKAAMDSTKAPIGVATRALTLGTVGAGVLNSVLGGGGGGGSGGSGGASTLQQQRASLSPTFSAQLGAPRGMFSALGSAGTPYNPRPISNITPGYAVRPTGTTATTDTSSYGDVNGDGVIDAADAAIVNYYLSQQGGMPQFSVGGPIHGYAHGSSTRRDFAVQGPGTGRSDSIPAVLSDGEYVMDAETVALLGDGSSKAGARRLDQFRTNLRREKGRNLAKGRFSVNAKAPEAYLSGGRT